MYSLAHWGLVTHICMEVIIPDRKVHGANMGPIWGRQDPGGPHVGPMNLAIWDDSRLLHKCREFAMFQVIASHLLQTIITSTNDG